MNKLFKILILTGILVCPSFLFAQSLSGSVVDSSDEQPISFANSVLLLPDSTVYKTIGTDDSGYFKLSPIVAGDYILGLSFVGFEPYFQNITIDNADINIGTVKLQPKMFDEVVVNGERVIRKADHQIILPSAQQLKVSNNGYNLLNNLQLNRIFVDPITKSVSKIGQGEVVLLINGKEVNRSEIMALEPKNIVRIDYYEDPTMRFYESAGVIDFIVKRSETGGHVSIESLFTPELSTIYLDNDFSAKYTYNKSEFTISATQMSRKSRPIRSNETSYTYPDRQIDRIEIGKPIKFITNKFDFNLGYNILELNNYYFSATLQNNVENDPSQYRDREGTVYQTIHSENQEEVIPAFDMKYSSKFRQNNPSLDLFFTKNLKKKQSITLNIVGTYLDSRNESLYQEWIYDEVIASFYSSIRGKKHSLIAEGLYSKGFSNGKLTAGAKHTQSYTQNDYKGDIDEVVGLRYALSYAYVQYAISHKQMSYQLSLGETRMYASQQEIHTTNYTFRPMLRIQYNSPKGFYTRFVSQIYDNTPSLSALSDVEQIVNPFLLNRGNPNLKNATNYNNSINCGYSFNKFNIDLSVSDLYTKNAISKKIFLEDNWFISQYDNQSYMHSFNMDFSLQYRPFGDYLTFQIMPSIKRFFSKGSNYYHTYTTQTIAASVMGIYKNWMFQAGFKPRINYLRGEEIIQDEKGDYYAVMYNKSNWNAGVAFLSLFSRMKQTDRNMSSIMPSISRIIQKDFDRSINLSSINKT